MGRRVALGAGAMGFALSAVVHLATFSPAAALADEGIVLLLFVGAFGPLLGMVARLRRVRGPARLWRRLAVLDWRSLTAPVPPGMRLLVFATAAYAVMNLVLSLLAGPEGPGASRVLMARLLSGHLLLLYLIPVVYFAFMDTGAPPSGIGSNGGVEP